MKIIITSFALLFIPILKADIIFFENFDPYSFEGLFQRFDPKKTGLIFCSKSGETSETIAHLLLSIEKFKRVENGIDIGKHFITVTQPGKNSIRTISMLSLIHI